MWRLDLNDQRIEAIPIDQIPTLNNDHVFDPNSEAIYLSANDGHIYRADLKGGDATRITSEDGTFHFLHGVSPDGDLLAYVSIADPNFSAPGRLMTMPA